MSVEVTARNLILLRRACRKIPRRSNSEDVTSTLPLQVHRRGSSTTSERSVSYVNNQPVTIAKVQKLDIIINVNTVCPSCGDLIMQTCSCSLIFNSAVAPTEMIMNLKIASIPNPKTVHNMSVWLARHSFKYSSTSKLTVTLDMAVFKDVINEASLSNLCNLAVTLATALRSTLTFDIRMFVDSSAIVRIASECQDKVNELRVVYFDSLIDL